MGIDDNHNYSHKYQDALNLVEDLIASIPFSLAEDLQIFQQNRGNLVFFPYFPERGRGLYHQVR